MEVITQSQLVEKKIENEKFLALMYNKQFAELIIKDSVVFGEEEAWETKHIIEENCLEKCYLLVGSEGFFIPTKEARALGANVEFSSHLAAVACYTNNPSLSLMGELYNKINKPAVQTRVFNRRESAVEW